MIVTFRSTAFNTSAPEKQFVSRRAYGGDLANWLIYQLARHDAAVEPMIGQKDAGWIVRFRFRPEGNPNFCRTKRILPDEHDAAFLRFPTEFVASERAFIS
jgi:hypothetical protein